LEWHAVEPGFDMMLTNIVQYKDFTFVREKSDDKGIMVKYLVETPDAFTSIGVNDKNILLPYCRWRIGWLIEIIRN
jgi:hypothetical protein